MRIFILHWFCRRYLNVEFLLLSMELNEWVEIARRKQPILSKSSTLAFQMDETMIVLIHMLSLLVGLGHK